MKCRIFSGNRVADVLGHLEGYPAIYIVADRNVAHLARRVADALRDREQAEPGSKTVSGSWSSAASEQESRTVSESCGRAASKPFGQDDAADSGRLRGLFLLDATEQDKSMATILDICKWLMDNAADRDALLLAIGGGIITDLAGFAASIYKRGIRCAYIPTTLLSQVDAAIGGKTGVNLGNYKNILGIIRQPEFTYICPEALETLPYRDFLSGAAELLKTFIIDDSDGNYEKAVAVLSEIHRSDDHSQAIARHKAELEELISAAGMVKAGIVERDELETGERLKLNLGHTFAHAIEWESRSMQMSSDSDSDETKALTQNGISHGEAVAIGIVLAARLSEAYYGRRSSAGSTDSTACGEAESSAGVACAGDCIDLDKSLSCSLVEDFRQCGIPVDCPFPVESLAGAMRKDKKAEGGIVHFVLIRSIGDVCIEDLSVEAALRLLTK